MGKSIMRVLGIVHSAVIIYLPIICFVAMFIAFILQIFSRYVLTSAWTWPFEITILGFVWTIMFGACYALYRNDMINFPVIYDGLRARWQMILTIIGNLSVFVLLLLTIVPVYEATSFLYIQKSSILRIPFNIFFAPFLFTIIYYTGFSLYQVIKTIRNWRVIPSSDEKGVVDL
jgi:TRAP-type C4-dicarboxylate transport system permease small subunit